MELCDDPIRLCQVGQRLVLLTEWPEFREFDLAKVADDHGQPGDRRHPQRPGPA